MIRRPPRSTQSRSSAASDVYKRQQLSTADGCPLCDSKGSCSSHDCVCVCRDMFPSGRCLFMYRDVVTGAKSLYRISATLPSLRLLMLLGYLSSHISKIIVDAIGCDGSDYCVRLDNGLMYGAIVFALATSSYLDQRRRGFDVSALRYEDLAARPLDMCRVILEYCHLPVSLAEKAVKALSLIHI